MGLLDGLFKTFNGKKVQKNNTKSSENAKWHCGYCGVSLDSDDFMCPMCGGGAVDENGNSR